MSLPKGFTSEGMLTSSDQIKIGESYWLQLGFKDREPTKITIQHEDTHNAGFLGSRWWFVSGELGGSMASGDRGLDGHNTNENRLFYTKEQALAYKAKLFPDQ